MKLQARAWAAASILAIAGIPARATQHLTTLTLGAPGQGLQLSAFYIGDIGAENDVFAMPYRGGRSGLLARNRQSGAINLYRSDGATMNWLGPNGQTDPSFQFLFGDLDGDGLPDLVAQNPADGALYYYRNNGAALQYQGSLGAVGYTTEEWLADFDGDGKTDFIRHAPENQMIYVYRSNGSTLTPPLSFGPIGTNVQLVVGDINGDGKADFVGRDRNTGKIWIYYSNGTTATPYCGLGGDCSVGSIGVENDLYLADLDGDGKADLMARNRASGEVYYYRSNGSYFDFVGDVGWLALDPADGALRFADFNGDGKAEIVARAVPGVALAGQAEGSQVSGAIAVSGRATIATAVHVSFNGGATYVSTPVVNGSWLVFSPDAVGDVLPDGPATIVAWAQHADGDNAPVATLHLTVADKNPYYPAVDPKAIFPSLGSIVPKGVSYQDTVPATLDLAERGRWHLLGQLASHLPGLAVPPRMSGPAAYGVFFPLAPGTGIDLTMCTPYVPPCLDMSGAANWGKVATAMFRAREMSGYDLNDSAGTLTGQYNSMTTMLDYNATMWLSIRGQPYLTLPQYPIDPQSGSPIGPITVVLESLIARYEQDPGNTALKSAIDEYVRMHKDSLISKTVDGRTFFMVYDKDWDYSGSVSSLRAFLNGRAAASMFRWYMLTGSTSAFDIGTKLNDYMRDYHLPGDPAPLLWKIPSGITPQPGQFNGHIHSYMWPPLAYVAEAQARLKANPNDAIARDDVLRAKAELDFMSIVTGAGVLGNFGELEETGEMIRLALTLSELAAYFPDLNLYYYDVVERWVRNQLAEAQIDPAAAQAIGNNGNGVDARFDHVRDRSIGMFTSNASDTMAIPKNRFAYSNDDPANAFRGMYDAWAATLEFKGSVAQVNLLLNRAGQYLDVKSDLPYRGRLEIDVKSDIGPLKSLAVRTPGWTDRSRVTVALRDASGAQRTLVYGSEWTWLSPNSPYVNIPNLKASAAYVVTFPMAARKMPFPSLRAASNQVWYDADYGPNRPVVYETFTGTFLGDTLVAVDHPASCSDPTGCIQRYQRADLAALVDPQTLAITETAPPQVTVTRFAPPAIPVPGGSIGAVDAGLRAFDGSQQVKLACEPAGTLTSPLRLRGKDGNVYGVPLVDPADPAASKLKISTAQGIKALRKL